MKDINRAAGDCLIGKGKEITALGRLWQRQVGGLRLIDKPARADGSPLESGRNSGFAVKRAGARKVNITHRAFDIDGKRIIGMLSAKLFHGGEALAPIKVRVDCYVKF